MQISIDYMTEADAKEAAVIEADCFSQPWNELAFSNAVKDDNYVYITAKDADILIGYAGCVISFDEADVTNIAVTKGYRRQGIAEELLNNLMRLAYNKGVKKMYLEVRESNESARNLYNKLGFEQIGKRRAFYQRPTEDAVLMLKNPIGRE